VAGDDTPDPGDETPDPFTELFDLRARILKVIGPTSRTADALAAQLQRSIKIDPGVLAAIGRVKIDPGVLASIQRIKVVSADLAERMRRAWLEALPPNWRGMSTDDVKACVDMAMESGLNVVWVPRREIVGALLGAEDDAAREAVLIDRTGDVLDDLAATLAEVTHPDLSDFRAAAAQAIDACRGGHFAAAQSHAAAALSGVVHRQFGETKFSKARERFERDHPDNVELRLLRMTTLLHVFARALTHTDYAQPGFNRHATLHGWAYQHTHANAVAALLLLVGLLRELHEWFEREEEA
jgi:hypothetical protein